MGLGVARLVQCHGEGACDRRELIGEERQHLARVRVRVRVEVKVNVGVRVRVRVRVRARVGLAFEKERRHLGAHAPPQPLARHLEVE